MRAREFTINVPITIKINGDGDPEIDMPSADQEHDGNSVFVSPLQQELELKKAEVGKNSSVIDDLTSDEDEDDEHMFESDELARLKELIRTTR